MLLPLHNNLTVAPLLSGLSLAHRPHFAEYRRHAYMSNGWDPVYRWDGRSATMEPSIVSGFHCALRPWLHALCSMPFGQLTTDNGHQPMMVLMLGCGLSVLRSTKVR